MKTLIVVSPVILLIAIYVAATFLHTAYVKLSGKILRGTLVSWKHALIFSIGMTTITLIVKLIGLIGGISIPMFTVITLSFVLNLAFGGWYFSTRSFTNEGQQIGWQGAVLISGLAFFFYAITGVLIT